jgi:hypothetical protein
MKIETKFNVQNENVFFIHDNRIIQQKVKSIKIYVDRFGEANTVYTFHDNEGDEICVHENKVFETKEQLFESL